MADLGSWVVLAYDWAYIWPRGEVVHIYTEIGYCGRLCGGHDRPHTVLSVNKFATRRDFYVWALAHRADQLERMFFPVRIDRARAFEHA